MPQDIKTGSAYNTKVPQLSDTADIVVALTNYHYGVITGVAPEDGSVSGTAQTKSGIAGWFKYLDTVKANLASPALTGTPTTPDATAGTNTTQIANTKFVTSALATKANTASPTFTGTVIMDAVLQGPDTSTTQIFYQPTVTTKNATGTLAAADMLSGIVINQSNANINLTLDTGANMDTALTAKLGAAAPVGTAFRWSILAKSTLGITIYRAASGHEFYSRGGLSSGSNTNYSIQDYGANFITRKTGTNTYITYIID